MPQASKNDSSITLKNRNDPSIYLWRKKGSPHKAPFNDVSEAGTLKRGAERGEPYELTWSCNCARVPKQRAAVKGVIAEPLSSPRNFGKSRKTFLEPFSKNSCSQHNKTRNNRFFHEKKPKKPMGAVCKSLKDSFRSFNKNFRAKTVEYASFQKRGAENKWEQFLDPFQHLSQILRSENVKKRVFSQTTAKKGIGALCNLFFCCRTKCRTCPTMAVRQKIFLHFSLGKVGGQLCVSPTHVLVNRKNQTI